MVARASYEELPECVLIHEEASKTKEFDAGLAMVTGILLLTQVASLLLLRGGSGTAASGSSGSRVLSGRCCWSLPARSRSPRGRQR